MEHQLTYWNTLIDLIRDDRTIPITSRRRIARGIPASWDEVEKQLLVTHPEAEWANQRWARTFTNLVQGLCPGASVRFEEVTR